MSDSHESCRISRIEALASQAVKDLPTLADELNRAAAFSIEHQLEPVDFETAVSHMVDDGDRYVPGTCEGFLYDISEGRKAAAHFVTPFAREFFHILEEPPGKWKDHEEDANETTTNTVVSSMVKAGLLERRRTWRFVRDAPEGESEAFVIKFREKGDAGEDDIKQVIYPFLPKRWSDDGRLNSAVTLEELPVQQIRVTPDGENASADWKAKNYHVMLKVLLWVQRKGVFQHVPLPLPMIGAEPGELISHRVTAKSSDDDAAILWTTWRNVDVWRTIFKTVDRGVPSERTFRNWRSNGKLAEYVDPQSEGGNVRFRRDCPFLPSDYCDEKAYDSAPPDRRRS